MELLQQLLFSLCAKQVIWIEEDNVWEYVAGLTLLFSLMKDYAFFFSLRLLFYWFVKVHFYERVIFLYNGS
jgi:hypothetical protein